MRVVLPPSLDGPQLTLLALPVHASRRVFSIFFIPVSIITTCSLGMAFYDLTGSSNLTPLKLLTKSRDFLNSSVHGSADENSPVQVDIDRHNKGLSPHGSNENSSRRNEEEMECSAFIVEALMRQNTDDSAINQKIEQLREVRLVIYSLQQLISYSRASD